MKKFIAFASVLTLLASCGMSNDKGELIGVRGKKWHPEKPYGMALVPGGAFIMGKSDDDQVNVQDAPTKTVTVRSFYMDETEITNSEYRQFVEWVKDSITRVKLAKYVEDNGMLASGNGGGAAPATKEKEGIKNYSFADQEYANSQSQSTNPTKDSKNKIRPYDQYMYDTYYSVGTGADPYSGRKLSHKSKLKKETKDFPDKEYSEVIDKMYIPVAGGFEGFRIDESFNGLRTIDVKQLQFRYTWLDIEEAIKDKTKDRSSHIKNEAYEIYPDTTVWVKDFAYSYNDPMHNDYFWHQAYADYPVVGVTWQQAKAFCAWRTMYKNIFIKKKKGRDRINAFRLPTEAEWEYAARGGLQSGNYPWGGPYTTNDRGCYLANFKPKRGDYSADKSLYTVEANSYQPNGYNLYNMAGNVAEWTDTSYDANAYEFVSTMNPNVSDETNSRKVVRGGSWKDVAYFLQVGTRAYEYKDSARSYIGFRTVQDYMGTSDTGKK